MEEVVVTGMGCVSALGNTPEKLWENLLAGKSGVSTIEHFDTSAYEVHFAAEVKEFDASPYFSDRDQKRYSRNIQYAVSAASDAVKSSGLDLDSIDAVEMIVKMKPFLNSKIEPEIFKSVKTVQDIVNILEPLTN